MDFKNGVGALDCRLCGASYQMPVHHLHEPIDVFSEWLDDCEAAQRPQDQRAAEAPRYDEDEEEDDDIDEIPESSGLQQQHTKKPAAKATEAAPSYSALGLDDSDSDEDDD